MKQQKNLVQETVSEEVKKILADETLSKSKRIIKLYQLGYTVKQVSSLMQIRYNFAYNVLSNFTRLNNLQLTTRRNEDTKKQKIIELVKQGKSNTEISKILKTNYNYVYKVAKEYLINQ